MSATENKALIQRFFDSVMNRGDLAGSGDLFASGFVLEAPGIPTERGKTQGMPALEEWIGSYRTAFPDIRYAILNTVAEDTMIAVDFTATGTHRGAFAGIAPTGKSIEAHELGFVYASGGKIQRIRFSTYGTPVVQQLRG